MKTSRTAATTAVIPLLLTSLAVSAAEVPFNAPHTARAQESAQLLHQAARALGNLPDQHIANLWIFPTADANTVFAQYDVKGQGGASIPHLSVMKLGGSQIVEQTDLTGASAYAASGQERPTATAHWSASIGTGHAADTTATNASRGVPATPHWTAQIGTGAAASSANAQSQQSASAKKPAVADAHWTSRIGTGHSSDWTGPVTHASLTNGG